MTASELAGHLRARPPSVAGTPHARVRARTRSGPDRRGLTLVELIVVLVLIGVALALSSPTFLRPQPPVEPVQRIVTAARDAAIRRAESVTLSVTADGRWTVGGGGADSLQILSGTLDTAHASLLKVHISPLGACMLDSAQGSERRVTIDPLRCRVRTQ